MPRPVIDEEECTGCGICTEVCPNEVLDLEEGIAVVVDEEACDGCGLCAEECPMSIIEIEED
jgi:2-oxoacid:acceptor oxidoreductase delta subunit (pyruvate/2-ketoisovalerate family)